MLTIARTHPTIGRMEKPTRRGRPSPTPPPNYLTIKRAAELAGASYSTVYRAAVEGVVKTKQVGSSRFVHESSVDKIREALEAVGGRHADGRVAVYLRPAQERYERWARAAGAAKQKVSSWVASLADAASGGK